jgi:hypothetical protein
MEGDNFNSQPLLLPFLLLLEEAMLVVHEADVVQVLDVVDVLLSLNLR